MVGRLIIAFSLLALFGVAPLPAQTTQPASNPIKRAEVNPGGATAQQNSSSVSIWRVVGSLAAVIGLILLLHWGSRRLLPGGAFGGGSSVVRVVSRTSISPKQRILVVQVGDRLLVIGDSGQQLNTLCEIDDPSEAAELLGQILNEKPSAGRSLAAMRERATGRLAEASAHPPVSSADDQLAETREQLQGLMEQVRGMARQMNQA